MGWDRWVTSGAGLTGNSVPKVFDKYELLNLVSIGGYSSFASQRLVFFIYLSELA